ncbi:putative methyltransferase [Orchesella cincta]|uniref:Putative methyltransferase n=1 Tax=Orchesella cincta TaxID=48709 RepID=A0A1D2NKY6_ORCCI|nr:putative methyltransferase [Orchesella cincta]
MSLRFFEGQDHAKFYAKYRPIPPPELIERLVNFLQEKHDGPLSQAVDLGCGNGQCTFALTNAFSSVLGTDISPSQISEATACCKKMNVENVYEEARRVLVKNGVFAIIGYHLPVYMPQKEDETKYDSIKLAVDSAIEATREFWPEQALQVFHEYPNVNIPFSDFTRERGFTFQRKAKISDILGCICSYSPYQNFCKGKGENVGKDLLDNIANRIITTLNEGREKPLTEADFEEYEFTESVNYFVLMARI